MTDDIGYRKATAEDAVKLSCLANKCTFIPMCGHGTGIFDGGDKNLLAILVSVLKKICRWPRSITLTDLQLYPK